MLELPTASLSLLAVFSTVWLGCSYRTGSSLICIVQKGELWQLHWQQGPSCCCLLQLLLPPHHTHQLFQQLLLLFASAIVCLCQPRLVGVLNGHVQ